jgi:hypothetical protein
LPPKPRERAVCVPPPRRVELETGDRSEVGVEQAGLGRVDAHEPCRTAGGRQELGDDATRLVLPVGRHGVLEIRDDRVRSGGEGRCKPLPVVCGDEEKRPVREPVHARGSDHLA